jgi:hypothetical protein
MAMMGSLLAGAALPFVALFPEPPAFGRAAAGITAAVVILAVMGPCFSGENARQVRTLRRAALLFITTLTAVALRILLARKGWGMLPTIDLLPGLFGLEGEDIDDAVLYEAWVELWLACGAGVVVLDWVRRQLARRG